MEKGRTDRKFSVMMWGCIDMPQRRKKTYEGGREYINADKYTTILEDNIWPVIVKTLSRK